MLCTNGDFSDVSIIDFLGAGMQTILRRLLVCLHIYNNNNYIYIYIYIKIMNYIMNYIIYLCIYMYIHLNIDFMQQRMGMSQDWNTLFLKGRNNS